MSTLTTPELFTLAAEGLIANGQFVHRRFRRPGVAGESPRPGPPLSSSRTSSESAALRPLATLRANSSEAAGRPEECRSKTRSKISRSFGDGQRGGQRFPEVDRLGPGHDLQRPEGVWFRGADREILRTKLLAEGEDLLRHSRRGPLIGWLPSLASAVGGAAVGRSGTAEPWHVFSATRSRSVRCLMMIESDSRKTFVDVVGAHQDQGPGPVDRLGNRRRLLQIQLAHHVDHVNQPAGQGPRRFPAREAG